MFWPRLHEKGSKWNCTPIVADRPGVDRGTGGTVETELLVVPTRVS